MNHNTIARVYRSMLLGYFGDKEPIPKLDGRIYNFAQRNCGYSNNMIEENLKHELRWLKENYPQDVSNKFIHPSSHKVSEENTAAIYLSLASAYQDAGGRIPSIPILKVTSAYEFIRNIAPNRIRFCYIKKEE